MDVELHEFSYTQKNLCLELTYKNEESKNETENDTKVCPNVSVRDSFQKGTRKDFGTKSNPSEQNTMSNSKDSLILNFDETLRTLWDVAQSKGLFRYTLRELPFKILDGKYQFIAQLNPDRAAKRRKPQTIQSLNQPFNPNEFNFTKVKQEEFLMKLKPWWSEIQSDIKDSTVTINCSTADSHLIGHDDISSIKKTSERSGEEIEHFIMINVSPLDYGHVLLVPFLKEKQPQRITFDGLRMAVEMVLLNSSRDFRVGFNSLCGYASVNHHHYHAYYLKHRLHIEHTELHSVMGPCREIQNYPAPGFAFVLLQVDIDSLENFISNAFKLLSYLQEMNVAHNVFITRGSSQSSRSSFDAIRLIVWPRQSSFGAKECEAFNPALCELGGHFPIKNELSYKNLTEEYVSHELERICRETFTNIRANVASLYEDDNVSDFPLQSSVK